MAGKDRPEDGKGPLISTAPPPSSSKLESQDPISVETIRDDASPKALYWSGTLLMEGKFEMDAPATLSEIDGGLVSEDNSGEYRKTITTDAWKMWYPGNGAARFWACRNRYYQQLDAPGICFPAFTQEREGDATNEDLTHLRTYPGHVFVMSNLELEDALKAVRNMAIRPKGAPWKSFPGADLVNYMHGHMPGCEGGRKLRLSECQKCREIERALPSTATFEKPMRNTPPEYRRPGDLPMSDFVYLMKLDAPWDTPKEGYVHLVSSLPDFIKKQPPPLSRDLSKSGEKAA